MNFLLALDLEEMQQVRVASERINAETTLVLFKRTEEASPDTRIFHLFSGNARYHHAKMLKPWLERPEYRLKLHYLPANAPHLNPIERLWGIMRRHVTHNRSHANFGSSPRRSRSSMKRSRKCKRCSTQRSLITSVSSPMTDTV